MNRNFRGRAEWLVAKVFTDAATGLVVEVKTLQLDKPKYSLSIGSMSDKGVVRFVAPSVQVENAVAKANFNGMVLARLYDEAVLYVQEQVQLAEDKAILQKQFKEQKQMDFGKQVQKIGLSKFTDGSKTEREAGKRARREHNLAARRAADAERTSKSKSR